ncbi:MAG: nucleoside-diphosphate sugar epimerase [Chloroflexi bacterium]|nr:nucleoside-diphosphate sugar epimerase [Chloroflexota bacterium]MDL1940855.1 NAD-dependent epimerase/dehydratase family protein [Chloroflexi bacterium CFX2]
MILLTGASGKTGKALLKSLTKAEGVCAFVHREEQVSVASSLGAEKIIVGDLRDKVAIRSAMEGVRAVYHICPNMSPDEGVIGNLVIGEARKAGVEHFVYHSVLHPQIEVMNHHWQKMRVEERLFESGLPFTILQPAPYMQNLLAGWKSLLEDGVLHVPYSVEAKFSFLDLDDLAEAARIVLTEPGHFNATYELAGTGPTSHAEAAEVFGRVLGKKVKAEKEAIRDWSRRTGGMSGYAVENLVRMFEYYDQWGLVGNVNVLRWILRREPTSLETFVQRMIQDRGSEP